MGIGVLYIYIAQDKIGLRVVFCCSTRKFCRLLLFVMVPYYMGNYMLLGLWYIRFSVGCYLYGLICSGLFLLCFDVFCLGILVLKMFYYILL